MTQMRAGPKIYSGLRVVINAVRVSIFHFNRQLFQVSLSDLVSADPHFSHIIKPYNFSIASGSVGGEAKIKSRSVPHSKNNV